MRDDDWVQLDRDEYDWAYRSGAPCQVYYQGRWRAAWLQHDGRMTVDPWTWRIDAIDRYDLTYGVDLVARVQARYWSHFVPLENPPTDEEVAEAIASIRSVT